MVTQTLGGHWESHCTNALMKFNWEPLGADWPGVYIHYEYNALMCVYVGDFKISALADKHRRIWEESKGVIHMGGQT